MVYTGLIFLKVTCIGKVNLVVNEAVLLLSKYKTINKTGKLQEQLLTCILNSWAGEKNYK
jgi:hypothetical protein